jgi:hypothetical protein
MSGRIGLAVGRSSAKSTGVGGGAGLGWADYPSWSNTESAKV